MPMPVPASIRAMRGAPSRARGSKAKVAASAKRICSGRASPFVPMRAARRDRASSGATGCEAGWPGGDSSSHFFRVFQTSKPASGGALRARAPTASSTGPAQGQGAFFSASTSGRIDFFSASERAARSARRRAASSGRRRTFASSSAGAARPRALAIPAALGTHGVAGCTKANSSRRSNGGLPGCVFSRPAAKAAWTVSTAPVRSRAAASLRERCRGAPPASQTTAPSPAGNRAGTSIFMSEGVEQAPANGYAAARAG